MPGVNADLQNLLMQAMALSGVPPPPSGPPPLIRQALFQGAGTGGPAAGLANPGAAAPPPPVQAQPALPVAAAAANVGGAGVVTALPPHPSDDLRADGYGPALSERNPLPSPLARPVAPAPAAGGTAGVPAAGALGGDAAPTGPVPPSKGKGKGGPAGAGPAREGQEVSDDGDASVRSRSPYHDDVVALAEQAAAEAAAAR